MAVQDTGARNYGQHRQGKSGRKRHHKGIAAALAPEARRVGLRTARRATTDPFTTHVAMEEFISFRQGLKQGRVGLVMPHADLAPRVFPGSRTLIGQPEKRLFGLDS